MTTVDFRKASPIACSFDAALGVCVGWACFSKKDGEDYVDAHGDHFPDVELFKAVDALNRIPVEKRAINVEHAGPDRGVIVSAFALTEDFAKAASPKIDTGGTYGVLVTFKPDADLLKSIEAGEMVCLSIEGRAHDVETVAKSAGGIAATAHKRTMRQVELTKLAVVKAGAHEGAAVAIVKGAKSDPVVIWRAAKVAKRTPALTSAVDGHQHAIYDTDEKDGFTSWDSAMSTPYGGHSHPWVKADGGAITIGEAAGHTHLLATPATSTEITMSTTPDLAKQLLDATGAVAKTSARLGVAIGLSADQHAFAKRLTGAALEAFLDATDAERTVRATPIHKSERTGRVFYAGEEALVEFAKDNDALHATNAEQAKAAQTAVIAKAADKIPHVKGRELLAKAVHGVALTAEERTQALADLATIDASIATVTQPIGKGGGSMPENDTDPKVVLEKAAVAFIKSNPSLSAIEARREFGRTDEGQRLYAAAYPTD